MGSAMKQPALIDVDPVSRRDFDYYPTPAWMTRALLRRVHVFDVLEPCAGDGAIVGVLAEHGISCLWNDIDPSRDAFWHLDATKAQSWEEFGREQPGGFRYFWTVTNPPFNLAEQIVPLAVARNLPVAMILRLSWLEPTEGRQRFLERHPPSRLIVLPRHDWRGSGSTDSVTSAWMIWDEGSGRKGIEVVTKAERDELITLGAP